ncbi:helix-loop-helix DNA-binding domain-containing protein [Cunninghamella echinulata]|nr:helix-loop-helix DNA-binding domain-containing protein [Cunninghamella echinulata]
MNINNSIEENYPISKPGLRLTHPTAYHLQQQRLQNKDIDPTLDHSQLFLAQHQQQQRNESSPHLSDIDYAELTSPSTLHTDYMSYTSPDGPKMIPSGHHHSNRRSIDQDYLYDEHSIDSSLAFSAQMKRHGSDEGNSPYPPSQHHHQTTQQQQHQDFVFYTPVSLDQRFKQFAVSAPVNINYNHPAHPVPTPSSFNDDTLSDGTILSNTNLSYGKNQTDPHSLENQPDSLENYEDDYAAQINLQAIMEKRRRRRESHNAVERRRRDNINERIQELGTLLPDAQDDGINRLNKGTILKKSVEQIKQLQQDLAQYRQRVQELESILQQINVTQKKN